MQHSPAVAVHVRKGLQVACHGPSCMRLQQTGMVDVLFFIICHHKFYLAKDAPDAPI